MNNGKILTKKFTKMLQFIELVVFFSKFSRFRQNALILSKNKNSCLISNQAGDSLFMSCI